MASWIFKGVVGALVLALTAFSFGLFQLNSQVRRADQVVQEFNKQLADSATLITTKDAELNSVSASRRLSFLEKSTERERLHDLLSEIVSVP